MSAAVITDSGCLIALGRIGRLEILPALYDQILIPPVEREFGVFLPWLRVEIPADSGVVDTLKMLVDPGESEAIALAYERGFTIILDDKKARSIARNMGISMIGTVGILIKAKQAGQITELKPVLDELQRNGFYLSEALKAEAIRLVGE
ncbi:DUF3368 domain-containing protein [Laspinema olomoucense]|uniref:DUF3368 domain-containing protein n=1 Tax=Laspinema olomoucense TaxID=3231600 RepID=UPI0021BAD616|nr:DUF3368 domain-containing protein [Laspinema sp. D3c]MCT7994229.1 DUF3368 domain-containing protein [Laspinema sp. D3c]